MEKEKLALETQLSESHVELKNLKARMLEQVPNTRKHSELLTEKMKKAFKSVKAMAGVKAPPASAIKSMKSAMESTDAGENNEGEKQRSGEGSKDNNGGSEEYNDGPARAELEKSLEGLGAYESLMKRKEFDATLEERKAAWKKRKADKDAQDIYAKLEKQMKN